MKKYLLTVLLSFLLIPIAYCQDIITTRTGDEIQVKVMEITPDDVRFTKPDKPEVLLALPKTDIFMIKYANGTKDVFNSEPQTLQTLPSLQSLPGQNLTTAPTPTTDPATSITTTTASTQLTNEDLFLQGRKDARSYYKGYKTAATMTFITTFLFPPAGLITAIGTGVTAPAPHKLGYPDPKLMAQPEYSRGYNQKAKRTKTGKVWKNFGIGMGAAVALSILVSAGGQ